MKKKSFMGDRVEYTFGTDPIMVDTEIPTTQKKVQ